MTYLKKLKNIIFLTFVFSFTLFIVSLSASTSAQEIAIIVNTANSKNNLSMAEIREIYLGKTSFWNNLKIVPLAQRDKKITDKFLQKVVALPPNIYKGYWIKKSFQEGTLPPDKKDSSQEIIAAVSKEKGAIGYIWSSELKNKSGVKIVLRIE